MGSHTPGVSSEASGEMMKISHNYLGRYPFILNERFTNISANIEQAYRNQEMQKFKEFESNARNVTGSGPPPPPWTTEKKDQDYMRLRPIILKTDIDCAPRKNSPTRCAAVCLPFRKSPKSRFCGGGPTRYKVVHQFQSRFCR